MDRLVFLSNGARLDNYIGQHRECEMPKGIGFIPLGDRNRVSSEFGVSVVEERDSVDRYTKHHANISHRLAHD